MNGCRYTKSSSLQYAVLKKSIWKRLSLTNPVIERTSLWWFPDEPLHFHNTNTQPHGYTKPAAHIVHTKTDRNIAIFIQNHTYPIVTLINCEHFAFERNFNANSDKADRSIPTTQKPFSNFNQRYLSASLEFVSKNKLFHAIHWNYVT